MIPITVFAETYYDEYKDGDLCYELDYYRGIAKVTDYNGSGGDVTIPSVVDGCDVIEIGEEAFSYRHITNVTISEGVLYIDKEAFRHCNDLRSVTVPKSVTDIKAYAFGDCTGPLDIHYPGTRAEWNDIYKDEDWDYGSNYTLRCVVNTEENEDLY